MDSKKLCLGHNPDGVLWWRFWNPMVKSGYPWHYHEGLVTEDAWGEIFDGQPVDTVWTNNASPDGLNAAKAAREHYGATIISEVDDDYSACPKYNPAYDKLVLTGLSDQHQKIHDLADRTCVSTPYLVDKFGDKARLCPNFIVPEAWDHPHRESKKEDECVLLLAGGVGRAYEFMLHEDTLREFLDMPHTKIVVAGTFHHQLLDYPPGKVVWARWAGVHNYPLLSRWIAPDIMISPMVHNDFNLAKSNIKWLESAMLGACFLGERWGEYARTVEDGVTGHLADSPEEWREKLLTLARDKKVRTETSQAAKNVVLSDWTWDTVGADWRAALGV